MLSEVAHRRPSRILLTLGFLGVLAAALLLGGWLLWSTLRPAPAGLAPPGGQAVGAVDQAPAVRQYTIDARSRSDWAYFDFSGDAQTSGSPDGLDWDLGFRRTDVITNGGATNPAGVGAAAELGSVSLQEADVTAAAFVADVVDEERGLESPALHSWYSYDWTTHVVSSKGHAYAVKAATGELALITFLSYYCDDGSAGCITFEYVYPVYSSTFTGEP